MKKYFTSFSNMAFKGILFTLFLGSTQTLFAQMDKNAALKTKLDKLAMAIEPKVIAWRRDFHQNPPAIADGSD